MVMMKPNCSINVSIAKTVMSPSKNKRVLSSNLMNIKIQVCARFQGTRKLVDGFSLNDNMK